jgi:hypothetical protein
LDEFRPKEMKSAIPDDWNQMHSRWGVALRVALNILNIGWYSLPLGPVGFVNPLPVIVRVGLTGSSPAEYV